MFSAKVVMKSLVLAEIKCHFFYKIVKRVAQCPDILHRHKIILALAQAYGIGVWWERVSREKSVVMQ